MRKPWSKILPKLLGPTKPLMGDNELENLLIFFLFKEIKGSLCRTCKYYYKYKEEEAMGAEEEKKT